MAVLVGAVDVLLQARYLISLHNGMTVRCDGEERGLDFGQELNMIDAALKTAGVDIRRLESTASRADREAKR